MTLLNASFLKTKTQLEVSKQRPAERASKATRQEIFNNFAWVYPSAFVILSVTWEVHQGKCKFLHFCYVCGEAHSQSKCPQKVVAS